MNSVLGTIHVFADENGEEVNSILRPAPVQVLQPRVKKLSQKQLEEYHSVDTRILKQMR
jgi:hypothetical protein